MKLSRKKTVMLSASIVILFAACSLLYTTSILWHLGHISPTSCPASVEFSDCEDYTLYDPIGTPDLNGRAFKTSIELDWPVTHRAGNYQIYRKHYWWQPYRLIKVTSEHRFVDTGLESGQQYSYYVVATATDDQSIHGKPSATIVLTPN